MTRCKEKKEGLKTRRKERKKKGKNDESRKVSNEVHVGKRRKNRGRRKQRKQRKDGRR